MSEAIQHIAVMASAGTGKTYSLVENYLQAIFGLDGTGVKKRPQEILALTFTQKAAHEMRLRITKALTDLLTDDASLHAPEDIRRLLRALPNAPIATFHGFAASILRREAQHLGLDENFLLLEPREERLMARAVLRPLIFSEIMHNPSMQNLVARFRLGNGQQSLGLIDSLLSAYFTLLEKGLDSEELNDLTQAAIKRTRDIESCVAAVDESIACFLDTKLTPLAKARLDDISYCFNQFNKSLPLADEFLSMKRFMRLRMAAKSRFGDTAARASLVAAIIRLGACLVDHFLAVDDMNVAKLLSKFHDDFELLKKRTMTLSFGDLLHKTKRALLDDHALRKRIKMDIKHILVDEYQDTSPVQEDIIALLLESRTHEAELRDKERLLNAVDYDKGPSLFVVGDVKQSIYGFRGANSRLFDDMVNSLTKKSAAFLSRTLTVNRRSFKRVIDLVNLISRHTLSEQGYNENFSLRPHHDEQGRAALWLVDGDDEGDDRHRNLAGAAFGIVDLLTRRNDLRPSDIVVLVRRIKSAAIIKEKLLSFGVDAQIIGGDGFFQQQEIIDLISALKLVNDPGCEMAMAVVLRSPLVLLKDEEILRIASSAHGLTILGAEEAIENGFLHPESKTRLSRFLSSLAKINSKIMNEGLIYALDVIIDDNDVAYAIGHADNPYQKWANIDKLRAMLLKPRNPFVVVDELYARLFDDNKVAMAEIENSHGAVTIMTIHQAKGLEFKVVIVADGESTLPAHKDSIVIDKTFGVTLKPRGRIIAPCAPKDAQERVVAKTRFLSARENIVAEEKEELARILYVALTRAREEIYVVVSHETLLEKNQTSSLVGLFLQAYRLEKEEFLAICDIEKISRPPIPSDKHESESSTVDDAMQLHSDELKNTVGRVRLFASSLVVSENNEMRQLIDRNKTASTPIVDGNLAHKLLQEVASLMFCGVDFSLDLAIDMASRLHNINDVDIEAMVRITLPILVSPLTQAKKIVFEMPLISRPNDSVVIEGFADLVVFYEDHVGVIEFKSSARLVIEPNTYFQTLAYAHALEDKLKTKVKFSVMQIGSPALFRWTDYDDNVRRIFLAASDQR